MEECDDFAPLKRVAYWMTEKKTSKLKFDEFEKLCKLNRVQLIRINSPCDLDVCGPLDMIIHKIDCNLKGECDQNSARIISAFEKYLSRNPQVHIVDPLESVKIVSDRSLQYALLKALSDDERITSPKFVDVTGKDVKTNEKLIKSAGIRYPCLCKPFAAQGPAKAHEMSIIFHSGGLKDMDPPCVVQSFVPHNGVVFKVFVIGNKHFLVQRPSLKNFEAADRPTIFFNSHTISKPDSASELNEVLTPNATPVPPSEEVVSAAVTALRLRTGMALFGIDLIVESHTNKAHIVDVNSFPGYDTVPDLHIHLLQHLFQCLNMPGPMRRAHFLRSHSNMYEYKRVKGVLSNVDSGLGTDSEYSDCDKRLKTADKATGETFKPDWNRIKRFYGIPKPNIPKRSVSQEETRSEERRVGKQCLIVIDD